MPKESFMMSFQYDKGAKGVAESFGLDVDKMTAMLASFVSRMQAEASSGDGQVDGVSVMMQMLREGQLTASFLAVNACFFLRDKIQSSPLFGLKPIGAPKEELPL